MSALDLSPRPGAISLRLPAETAPTRNLLQDFNGQRVRLAGTVVAYSKTGTRFDAQTTALFQYVTLEDGTYVTDHLWVRLHDQACKNLPQHALGTRLWITGHVVRYWRQSKYCYDFGLGTARLRLPTLRQLYEKTDTLPPKVGPWVYWQADRQELSRRRYNFALRLPGKCPEVAYKGWFWRALDFYFKLVAGLGRAKA